MQKEWLEASVPCGLAKTTAQGAVEISVDSGWSGGNLSEICDNAERWRVQVNSTH